MHIWTSWGVLGCPRVSWGIKTDRPHYHRNVIGYESHDRPDLLCQKSIFIYKKHYYVPFYIANEKIFYAEDRAKMNRELNLFVLWEIGFLARQIGHGSTMRSRLS